MKSLVIDASVVTRWLIREEMSDIAIAVRDSFLDGTIDLHAPNLLPFEVLNSLWVSKLFSTAELKEAAVMLENYAIQLYPVTGDYAKHVLELASEMSISVYDAAYVGLGDIIKSAILTGDKKLTNKLGLPFKDRIYFLRDFDLKKYVEASNESKDESTIT